MRTTTTVTTCDCCERATGDVRRYGLRAGTNPIRYRDLCIACGAVIRAAFGLPALRSTTPATREPGTAAYAA